MPSTFTSNLGIEKPAPGEQSGTWGTTTNENFDLIDQAISGVVSVTLPAAGTTGSPNDLPITDGSLSAGRARFIEFVDAGDLGGTAYVQLTPNDAQRLIFIRNNLSGGRSLIVFQGTYNASNDFEIPNGKDASLLFNGAGTGATVTNVNIDLLVSALTSLGPIAGTTGTFSGNVTGANLNVANWNTAFGWGNWAANFGTGAGNIAQGNDSRINNGQTAFGWGNWASNFGTTGGTIAEGNDSRFSDAQTAFGWGNWASNFGTTSGTIAEGNDSRILNGQTAFGWGDWSAGVDKAFVDALNVDADTLDGNDSTAFATAAQGTLADSAVQNTGNETIGGVKTFSNTPVGLFKDHTTDNANAKLVRCTQAEYNALSPPDANTIYFIVG